MNMIYGAAEAAVAGPILRVLGLSTAFICLIAPINSILQAVGRADIPVKVVLVGGVIKFLLNLLPKSTSWVPPTAPWCVTW